MYCMYEMGKVWDDIELTLLFFVAYLIVFWPCCLTNVSSNNHFIVRVILQIEADMTERMEWIGQNAWNGYKLRYEFDLEALS